MTTMPPQPRPALQPGQRAPNFALANTQGNPERFYDRFVGNLMALCFVPSQHHPAALRELKGFVACLADLAAAGSAVVAVTRETVSGNAALCSGQGIAFPLYADPEGVITRGYGAATEDSCTTYLLDRNQRVLAAISGGTDHAGRVLAIIRDQVPPRPTGRGVSAQAPVLLVPGVFGRDLCAKAVAAWETHHTEGEVGLPSRAYAAEAVEKPTHAVYTGLKKRLDHVADDTLNPELMNTVMTRLAPELRKAFQFQIGGLERICIGAYGAERGDYFRPHRDNITELTKTRRFAVSIALNDDYEGGGVRFAEFSDDVYDPPVGGALVFSCSLLHEALPITRGTRIAAFTFLFGPGHRADKPLPAPDQAHGQPR